MLPKPRIRVHSVQGDGFRWPVVLHSHGGEACPDCGGTVIGINHRAHHIGHHKQLEELEEAVRTLAAAVRLLATEAGHGDWYASSEPIAGVIVGAAGFNAHAGNGGEDSE